MEVGVELMKLTQKQIVHTDSKARDGVGTVGLTTKPPMKALFSTLNSFSPWGLIVKGGISFLKCFSHLGTMAPVETQNAYFFSEPEPEGSGSFPSLLPSRNHCAVIKIKLLLGFWLYLLMPMCYCI